MGNPRRRRGGAKRGRKTKALDPKVLEQIVAYVRAGAYEWVAAAAAGIHKATLYRWLQWGEERREPFRAFRDQMLRARAEARVAAEVAIHRDDKKFWLTHGPGKDRPGEPGWTETVHAEHTGAGGGPIQVQSFREEFVRRIERLAARRDDTRVAAAGGPPAPLSAKRGTG